MGIRFNSIKKEATIRWKGRVLAVITENDIQTRTEKQLKDRVTSEIIDSYFDLKIRDAASVVAEIYNGGQPPEIGWEDSLDIVSEREI